MGASVSFHFSHLFIINNRKSLKKNNVGNRIVLTKFTIRAFLLQVLFAHVTVQRTEPDMSLESLFRCLFYERSLVRRKWFWLDVLWAFLCGGPVYDLSHTMQALVLFPPRGGEVMSSKVSECCYGLLLEIELNSCISTDRMWVFIIHIWMNTRIYMEGDGGVFLLTL